MKALNEEEDFSIPMTPMIDIVFQLLIFFLLATTIQKEEVDLQIQLTKGTQGVRGGGEAQTRLIIGVRNDGSYTLGAVAIEWLELRKRVMDAARGKVKPSVQLRADKDAPHGKVAWVYQLCEEIGVNVNEKFSYEEGAGGP